MSRADSDRIWGLLVVVGLLFAVRIVLNLIFDGEDNE